MRKDLEKKVTENDVKCIKECVGKHFKTVMETDTVGKNLDRTTRKDGLNVFMKKLSSARLVVTDRMHCMIFCALLGVPCIVFDNSYSKVKECYRWLENLEYINFVEDLGDLEKLVKYPWKRRYRFPEDQYKKEFLPLIERIEKGE